MKAQTLRHLLLLSGKSLALEARDRDLRSRIVEVCDSLSVTRERRSPYRISYHLDGKDVEIFVEDHLFLFHVRGDVPSRLQMTQHRDVRTENWNGAIELWGTILGENQLGQSNQIAPTHDRIGTISRQVRFVQALILVASLVGTFIADSETAIALLPLFLYGTLSVLGLKNDNLNILLIVTVALVFLPVQLATSGIVAYSAIEALTSITTRRYAYVAAYSISAIATILVSDVSLVWRTSPGSYVLAVLWCALAIFRFPRSVSSDMTRSSIPLAVAFALVTTSLDVSATTFALLVALCPLISWRVTTSMKPNHSAGVPVSIRKR